ncbi:uncharacterized protein LOC129593165 [Paramacrobiotus metropolitanus]|uniref:uncharacterized protein LOC129593165 n=1 Tax=Paramacrobiotus metropolitanus TaxID=2943436 RepID=UPI002445C89A|nr:uncharacterized protein LOC129593165 [Paramacrobiotus metropolitanus]
MDISSSASFILDGFSASSSHADCISLHDTALLAASSSIWSSWAVAGFLQQCRLFGLYLHPTPAIRRPTLAAIVSGNVWRVFLIFFAALVGFLDTWKSVERHKNRLTTLEFTAIGMAFYRFVFVTVTVVVACHMRRFTKQARTMLLAIDDLSNEIPRATRWTYSIRQKVARLAWACTAIVLTTIIVDLVANYYTFAKIAGRSGHELQLECGWHCPTAFPIAGSAPAWFVATAYSVSMTFEFGMVIYPQLLVFLLIYPLGLWLDMFSKSIKVSYELEHCVQQGHVKHKFVYTMRQLSLSQKAHFHLRLTRIVAQLDAAFSSMSWLLYLNDLMGFIATASLILRHKSSVKEGDSDFDLLPLFLMTVAASVLFATLRTGCGVWVSEKAHSCLPYLHELNLRVTAEEDRFLCSSFVSRLQGSRIALTAGGFFYITREFVITIFGVLLTYILFVYQMQDQKEDMSRLLRLQDFISALPNATPSTTGL